MNSILDYRASGVLLHPTALPNAYPIGDLGPTAYQFIDILAECGQTWWQMLPIGPVGQGHSPYASPSAFAGNPLLISPDFLVQSGFLDRQDIPHSALSSERRVDYEAARRFKQALLAKAYERFQELNDSVRAESFGDFCVNSQAWLDDFTLFMALRQERSSKSWTTWEPELAARSPKALEAAGHRLAKEIRYQKFIQWLFDRQWIALKEYAHARGVGLIGDVPIFVAADSADVWAHRAIFKLKADGTPDVVAGVPPDYFSKTGQKWGNPHYRWGVLRRHGYDWWMARFRRAFDYFDAVRLDHFIGFSRYYEIPAEAKTAEKGRYHRGPGSNFFRAVFETLGPAPLIAEDLGILTPEVEALRDEWKLPGMRVLQFAFSNGAPADHDAPDHYPERAVAYTGTHDNDTTVGWFQNLNGERSNVLSYLHSDGSAIHWDMIRAVMASPAHTAIIPMQDLLGLGSEARMNRPGIAKGNWAWRLAADQLTGDWRGRWAQLTESNGRRLSQNTFI